MRRPENLRLKYFLKKMALCDVWKLFSYVFLWRWRPKGSVVLKFESCEQRDGTSIVDGDRRFEVLIVFVLKDQVKKVPSLDGGIEQCGSSSCLGGLRSLLNTEGILTSAMFLMSDGSLIWMWNASFAQQCRVLLSVYYCKFSKFFFWVFCGDVVVSDGTGGLISMLWNSFSCAVVGWAFPEVDYISSLYIWNGSFGCTSKDLVVLVLLKKTLNFAFC